MPLQSPSAARSLGFIGAILLVLSACGGGAADVVNGVGGTDSGAADGLCNGMVGIVQTTDSPGQLQMYRPCTSVGQMRRSVRRQGSMTHSKARAARSRRAARQRSQTWPELLLRLVEGVNQIDGGELVGRLRPRSRVAVVAHTVAHTERQRVRNAHRDGEVVRHRSVLSARLNG